MTRHAKCDHGMYRDMCDICKPPPERTSGCAWRQRWRGDFWQTTCGHEYENNDCFQFCPFCGKPIENQ